MAPITRKLAWYRRIVILATALLLVCVMAWWTIRPAVAQPSYCTPDPKEPLVGCWIAARDDGLILKNVYVYTSGNTFYEFPRFQGIPTALDKQHPSGFWRFQANGYSGELVINRLAYNEFFGNAKGPEIGSSLSFARDKNSFDETITWSPNPDINGSRAHLERLGVSSSFTSQSLDQAAQELVNTWDHGENIAQITRGFFDFGRACLRDRACSTELRKNFDWEKWWSIEIGTLFILLPEVRVARLAETGEGGLLLRLSKRFSKKSFQSTGLGGRVLTQAEQVEFDAFAERASDLGYVENPYRTGSWGNYNADGKFVEMVRIDLAEAGKGGWLGRTHIHISGQSGHLPINTPLPGE